MIMLLSSLEVIHNSFGSLRSMTLVVTGMRYTATKMSEAKSWIPFLYPACISPYKIHGTTRAVLQRIIEKHPKK